MPFVLRITSLYLASMPFFLRIIVYILSRTGPAGALVSTGGRSGSAASRGRSGSAELDSRTSRNDGESLRGAVTGGRCRGAGTGGRCRGAGTGGRCLGAGTGGRCLGAGTGGRSLGAGTGGRSLGAGTGGRSLGAGTGGRSLGAGTGGRSLGADTAASPQNSPANSTKGRFRRLRAKALAANSIAVKENPFIFLGRLFCHTPLGARNEETRIITNRVLMNNERRRYRNTWKDVTIYRYLDI